MDVDFATEHEQKCGAFAIVIHNTRQLVESGQITFDALLAAVAGISDRAAFFASGVAVGDVIGKMNTYIAQQGPAVASFNKAIVSVSGYKETKSDAGAYFRLYRYGFTAQEKDAINELQQTYDDAAALTLERIVAAETAEKERLMSEAIAKRAVELAAEREKEEKAKVEAAKVEAAKRTVFAPAITAKVPLKPAASLSIDVRASEATAAPSSSSSSSSSAVGPSAPDADPAAELVASLEFVPGSIEGPLSYSISDSPEINQYLNRKFSKIEDFLIAIQRETGSIYRMVTKLSQRSSERSPEPISHASPHRSSLSLITAPSTLASHTGDKRKKEKEEAESSAASSSSSSKTSKKAKTSK